MYAAGGYSDSTNSSVPAGGGLQPINTIIHHNYLFKDLNWQNIRFVKNGIEQKNGKNSHISYNLLEYMHGGNYSDGQWGTAIAIANRAAGSNDGQTKRRPAGAPTQNIEVDHIIAHHIGIFLGMQGPYDDHYAWDYTGSGACNYQCGNAIAQSEGVAAGTNWNIHDNFADDINKKWTITYPVY